MLSGQGVFQRISEFFRFSLISHTVIYVLGSQYNKDFIVCQVIQQPKRKPYKRAFLNCCFILAVSDIKSYFEAKTQILSSRCSPFHSSLLLKKHTSVCMPIISHNTPGSYPGNHDFALMKLTRCLCYQLIFFLATTTFWTDVIFVQFGKCTIYCFVMNMTTNCAHVLLHG